ncbi:MAG TPA: MFS transporter, partial [Candidatus Berkiella sp.]|nr:MFS transporter [Candidatus Berkiella sp.]
AYEFVHRVVPSIITDELRSGLSINDHQLGTIGAMYFYAYAAFQLPAGVLIDRYGVKNLLVAASAILTLGSFLFATTSSIHTAQMSRFLIGIGSAFAFIGCLKIGAQWLAMSSFPLVVGLTNLCGTLGALIGGKPMSYLAHQFGWRDMLLQLSFVGLVITLLLWIFIQDKPIQQEETEHKQPGLLTGLIAVMKNPQSWIIALYGMLLVAPIAAIPEMWGVEYLKVAYNIPATQAAGITHTIFVGTAVGGPLIGWLMTHKIEEVDFMMIATLGA